MIRVLWFVLFLMAYGLISLLMRRRSLNDSRLFVPQALQQLQKYLSSNGVDLTAHTWLLQNALRIQDSLGTFGIMDYKPPFANHIHRSIPIVPTLLQELRRGMGNHLSDLPTVGAQEAGANLQEFLLMRAGQLDNQHLRLTSRLRNPLEWLREGGSTILLLPFLLPYIFGVFSPSWLSRLSDHWLLKLLSAIASILGFLYPFIKDALALQQ